MVSHVCSGYTRVSFGNSPLDILPFMSDNTSKRRRGLSISTQGLTNLGSSTTDSRDPLQIASPSQTSPVWNSAASWYRQTFSNPLRSSVHSDTSIIGHQNSEGKMLLPSLPKRVIAISRIAEKNRTTHACDLCRKAKAKCTGGQPCQKCKNEGRECVYGDGKRDKERKTLERTARHNESLRGHAEALRVALRGVVERLALTESEQNKVSELLAKSPSAFSDNGDDSTYVGPQQYTHRLHQPYDENQAGGDIGSTDSLDAIEVDTNRDAESRAAGFLGKSSSVRWIQRAEREVNAGSGTQKTISGLPMYHTGDPDLYGPIDQGNHASWKYQLPPFETATKLVDSYFVHVHPDFPILFKDSFMQKFHHYLEDRGRGFSESDNMALSQINCVFAISSTFEHLAASEHNEGDHRDHLVYYARIRALGLEQQPKHAHTSLEYVCTLGLLGLYLVSNFYVNRAWNMVGLAIRNAVTLGLHIRSDASQLSILDKELRIRIWWSLFSLEHLLNEITGRPGCISYRDISAPHPIDCSEEELFANDQQHVSSNSQPSSKRRRSSEVKGKGKAAESQKSREIFGLSNLTHTPFSLKSFNTTTYFIHRIALNVLTHEILNRLFSAAVVNIKWYEVQDIMREIDSRLQKWKSNLPGELIFPILGNEEEDEHQYQKKGLAVMYHTARMILHRPSLCRMDGRIKDESSASQKFNGEAVAKCVESARALLATIGKPAGTSKLYLIQPWWEILHHLCQAAGILMLEIAFCVCHTRDEAPEVLQDAKDAVHWLRAMSGRSVPACKAWQAHDRTLRLVATKINADISDMAMEPEMRSDFYQKPAQHHNSSFDVDNIPALGRSNHGLSGFQSQNLAATSEWVQHGLFQEVPASQAETNQYTSTEYPGQSDDFRSMFRPSVSDPYGTFDSPGFPWNDHGAFPEDPSQEMQRMGNVGYQPYSSGLVSPEMGMTSHDQEDTAQSSRLQYDNILHNIEGSYQDVEGQFPTETPYRGQRWHEAGGG